MTLDQDQVEAALPSYQIGAELGRGGWGVVLAGTHRQLGREVAIKQLPRAFAADRDVRARFTAEARVLASLDHPHIVPVYDYVEQDGLCLLVMEQLPGGTLWSRFSTEGFTPPAATAAVLASIAGLQAAHEHHILHRDVKPENLMFSASGALKVTDFGIAKVVGGEGTLATRAGEVVGTPAYIAPEQARGATLSPATDVYAVATMFYELLSGQLPFADDADAMALLFKHAFESPVPLLEVAPFVPASLAEVVMRGLATEPTDRYPTAEAFGVAIAEAATSAWGAGWLAAEGTPVMGASSIVAATDRVTTPPRAPTLADQAVAAPVEATPAPRTVADAAPVTPADATPPPPAPAPPTIADLAPAPPTIADLAPVRPTNDVHRAGVDLADVDEGDLVPVKEVLTPPAKATVPLLIAAALVVITVIIALVGLGSGSSGGLPANRVTVAGKDPAGGQVLHLDLSKPIPVGVAAGVATSATRAKLTLQALGQQVSQSSAPLKPFGTGRVATIDASSARYLYAGRFTARLDLVGSTAAAAGPSTTPVGQPVSEAHVDFGVQTKQFGLLSAGGAVVILVLLFAGAYAESFARSLRKGKRSTVAMLGLAGMGALIGIAIVGLAWVLAIRLPTVATVVVCAVLGAAAGAAGAVGSKRVGRQRRYGRAVRREQRA
jgi:Protein kinase domain